MRKDYQLFNPAESEIDRIEAHWTQFWEQQGYVAKSVDYIGQDENYRLLRPYLQRIPPNGRVLDAGCGMGQWVIYLAQQGFDAYGVDISAKTIEQLQAHFPEQHFQRADIRKLDFEDSYFDLVFSWGVFEHFEDGLGNCIVEARRVLKPGGYLIITVPFQNQRHRIRDRRPFARWDDADLLAQAKETGREFQFYQWRLTEPELTRELAIRGFDVLQVNPASADFGLSRTLRRDFRAAQGSRRYRMLFPLLKRALPSSWVSHMLFAAAVKQ